MRADIAAGGGRSQINIAGVVSRNGGVEVGRSHALEVRSCLDERVRGGVDFIPAHCSGADGDAMDIPQEVASLRTCVDKSPQSPIAYDLFSSSSSLAIPVDEATKTGNASIPNKNCESNALR